MIIRYISPNVLIFRIIANNMVIIISLPHQNTSLYGDASLHLLNYMGDGNAAWGGNYKNKMNMIWHDIEYIKPNTWVMRWNCLNAAKYNFTGRC